MIALIVVCYVLVILFAWSLCVAAKRSREAEDRALSGSRAGGSAVGFVGEVRRGEAAGSGTLVNEPTMAGESRGALRSPGVWANSNPSS